MPNKAYTIGIIGGGFVGNAVASFFKKAAVYDKYKPMDSFEEVMSRDIVFVCVPTPYDKGFNRSCLDDVFKEIGKDKKEHVIVIKSTAVPGTTEYFQKQYKYLKVLFNPEFLTQSSAEYDFSHPDKQIIGYTKESKNIANDILSILPEAQYRKIMPATAAELVKYAVNSYYASKVIFGNVLYDIALALGVDYEVIKEAFVSDKRICDSHFDVMHGGYRGYGGKCLPKDLLTLYDLGKSLGVDVSFLDAIDKTNRKLGGDKNLPERE